MARATIKYLENYADQRLWQAQKLLSPVRQVLVIPAFNEGNSFVDNLKNFKEQLTDPALIIVVVNAPLDATSLEIDANIKLLETLKTLGKFQSSAPEATLVVDGNFHLLIAGPFALERSQGVGLARKIGADFAVKLIYENLVQCPIIFCTDADAILPKCYFSRAEKAFRLGDAAAVFPFIHESHEDERQASAMFLYEQRLHHYVEGLKSASSPYAFHTIGSTMALSAGHYAEVRGFPSIPAGEDFYLLNKLRKVGKVLSLAGEPIRLSARISDRVLFGTGTALARILHDNEEPKNARIFYDQRVFEYLKELIRHAEKQIIDGICDITLNLDEPAKDAFTLLDRGKLTKNLRSRTSTTDRLKAFHDYFDAFKTLKFIHHLRDKHFPMRTFY